MGYRAVLALAVVAMLALAWRQLRARPWRGSIPATFSLLILPALLLLAADGHALYLYLNGCISASGGSWRPAGLSALALANAGLAASVFSTWRKQLRLSRVVHALPPLAGETADRLAIALPALAGVALRVCPADHPILFTMGGRRPVIVVSSWVLAHLDEQELVGALAHELGHIAHRDGSLLFLAHALCPGGLGLFGEELRQLSSGVEQRADAWAAERTADRLALASALVKVSRFSLPRRPGPVTAFAGQTSAVQARVNHLLAGATASRERSLRPWWPLLVLAVGMAFLLLQIVSRFCSLHAV